MENLMAEIYKLSKLFVEKYETLQRQQKGVVNTRQMGIGDYIQLKAGYHPAHSIVTPGKLYQVIEYKDKHYGRILIYLDDTGKRREVYATTYFKFILKSDADLLIDNNS